MSENLEAEEEEEERERERERERRKTTENMVSIFLKSCPFTIYIKVQIMHLFLLKH
jgi:hypothetical protein